MSMFSQFAGSGIKSIQRGVITIPVSAFSATATISSVNPAKSELRFLGGSGVANDGTNWAVIAALRLTNATTITATRQFARSGNTFASDCTVSWELTEWY